MQPTLYSDDTSSKPTHAHARRKRGAGSTLRDHSRTTEAKHCDLSRRMARRAKSARLFLTLAFPAELATH